MIYLVIMKGASPKTAEPVFATNNERLVRAALLSLLDADDEASSAHSGDETVVIHHRRKKRTKAQMGRFL